MDAPVSASAVVLAGGDSRRLGRNKAFVRVGGKDLLQRALDATRGFDPVILVANDLVRCRRALGLYGWRLGSSRAADGSGREYRRDEDKLLLISDLRPGLGPLAGIEAGLQSALHDLCWVVGCDLPFLTPELGRHLVGKLAAEQRTGATPPLALVPVVQRQPQPLCAAYDRKAITVVKECLDRDVLAMDGFLDRLPVLRLPIRRLTGLPEAERLFFNVNTPEQLAEARRRIDVTSV